MRTHRVKSLAIAASVIGAAFMIEAVSAQAPDTAPAAPAAPAAKPRKKVTSSVVVAVTNSRRIALTALIATPSGGTPKALVANLAAGKRISVSVATAKSCVFALHATYADGSSAELDSINLCNDKTVNLTD
jgi:hypothetical protein